jgi:PAS domain S-box-containing protein
VLQFSEKLELEIEFNKNLNPSQLCWIFESLPEICFFTKNLHGTFTQCNAATLKLFGLQHKHELIGSKDEDFFSPEIAKQYRQLDLKIMNSGEPEPHQIEPVPNQKGELTWVSTTKIPLFDHSQKVVGVAVIIKNLSEIGVLLGPYQQLNPCIEYIFEHYASAIKIQTLADLAMLSIRQLERQFKRLFKLTPLQYINNHRIQIACLKLKQSNTDISEIAIAVGFYDHSHFIRLFKSTKNITPSQYRKSHSSI